jgi:tetratricopeptide (TPR) repeat protein
MTAANANPSDTLATAIRLHQEGRLDEAEALYRQLLGDNPDHAEALHLLGVLADQRGRTAQAVELIGRALALQPENAVCHVNLAEVYRRAGDLTRAESHGREALRRQPANAEAHNLLGLVLQRLPPAGDEAVSHFEAARAWKPSWPAPYLNLGNLLRERGRPEEAAAVFRDGIRLGGTAALPLCVRLGELLLETGRPEEALAPLQEAARLAPADPELLSNLGDVLTILGRTEEARASYQQAVRLAPGLALPYSRVGTLLQAEGKLDEALSWFAEAIRRDPDNPALPCQVARVLSDQDKPDEAVACAREAVRRWPGDAESHYTLGRLLKLRGDVPGALAAYREALRLRPDYADALVNLGVSLAAQGEREQALAAYRAALRHAPEHAEALAALADALRGRLPPEDVAACERVLARGLAPGKSLAALRYGLAQVMDARGEFARAAALAGQANAFFKEDARRRGQAYDPEQHRAFVDRWIRACPASHFRRVRGWGLSRGDALAPVFVLGLPRSGTSLVEQILASHPHVFGAGELTFLFDAYRSIPALLAGRTPGGGFPLDRATVQALARQYLDRLRRLSPRAVRVVDKMPDNYLLLGLIATLFPRARVIHTRRDVRDVALSCWLTGFESVPWACDLEHIGARVRDCQRLMAHWRRVLPLPMLEIDYEEIVADLEPAARRLVDWIGLPWHPACLAFHQTKREVRTASVHQVREPLYRSSVGRWRHYQDVLAPVLKMLALPG